ncbi:MAG: acyltransferase [Phycisphaerae bacterium]|nr:acyltransferase [Phycisphaerae bacterium]
MSDRNYNVDRLRIIAAFGIVWFHTQGLMGRDIAYAGLAVFIMLAFTYVTLHSTTSPCTAILTNRFKRLIIPWIFWCLVYEMTLLGRSMISNTPNTALVEQLSLRMLLIGTAIHLWYLPFAFVMTAMAVGLSKMTRMWGVSIRIMLGFALSIFAFALSILMLSRYRSVVPLAQWSWGLPAVFIGITLGLILQLEQSHKRIMISAVLTLFVVGISWFNRVQHQGLALSYSIAVVLTAGCLLWPGHLRLSRGSQWLVSLTLGIYLIHPLVGSIIRHMMWFDMPLMAVPPVIFTLSALLTQAIKKTPFRAIV